MPRSKYFVARVMPQFSFPIDMLRYDGCYPRHEQDSGTIIRTFGPYHECSKVVEIVRPTREHTRQVPHGGFTIGRWDSFSCPVLSVEDDRGVVVYERLGAARQQKVCAQ